MLTATAVQSQAQAELNQYIESQAEAIAPEPKLPRGYSHDCVSELFGTLHRIYQGSECIGTFGRVGKSNDFWINSKLYANQGTFPSAQAAATQLVHLWERDCPALAAA